MKTKKAKRTDADRLDWLQTDWEQHLQDIRWHVINEDGTVRDAIDYFMDMADQQRGTWKNP